VLKFPDPLALIEGNLLKLLRPLDRETTPEVRLTIQCNVSSLGTTSAKTTSGDTTSGNATSGNTTSGDTTSGGPKISESFRHFRRQVVITVDDLNDNVRNSLDPFRCYQRDYIKNIYLNER
jgi:hypothetical protein